jgi:hypothetical protein
MDKVAGRLNLDSLISGLRSVGLEQARQVLGEDPEFDFDIIDRSV